MIQSPSGLVFRCRIGKNSFVSVEVRVYFHPPVLGELQEESQLISLTNQAGIVSLALGVQECRHGLQKFVVIRRGSFPALDHVGHVLDQDLLGIGGGNLFQERCGRVVVVVIDVKIGGQRVLIGNEFFAPLRRHGLQFERIPTTVFDDIKVFG